MEPTMKNFNTILAVGAVAAVCGGAEAAVYYSTNFSSGYVAGGLVGQNGWGQTGTISTNPIQVNGGEAVVGTSGQDVFSSFSTVAPTTAGSTLYFAATMTVTAAQATGDYFLHVSDPAGTPSNFYGRLFAKSSGSGFVLGLSPNTTTATYGSSVLNFNQSYQVVVAWDFVAGASNDSFSLFVNPNSTDRASLSAYVVSAAFASGEPTTQVSAINLRQGNASNAPSVRVSTLAAGSSLADVGVIPAPGALALLGAAGLVGGSRRRR
jgi:hypothetical protein